MGPENCNLISLLSDSDAHLCLRSPATLGKRLRPCESPLEFPVPRPISTRVDVNYDEKYQEPKQMELWALAATRCSRPSKEQSAVMRNLRTLELFKLHIRPSQFEYRNNTTSWRESGLDQEPSGILSFSSVHPEAQKGTCFTQGSQWYKFTQRLTIQAQQSGLGKMCCTSCNCDFSDCKICCTRIQRLKIYAFRLGSSLKSENVCEATF